MKQTLRGLFVSAPRAQPVDLRGRSIIVTGASPGSIGFATAQTLAAWGANVTITTRRQPEATAAAIRASLPAAAVGRITAQALDLCDAASVERFVAGYAAQSDRLDVLVNNAGIHLDLRSQWKTPRLTADGHEIHWRTNYLGTMHLTQRLLPLLCRTGERTGDARIVNVVSMLHAKGRNDGLFQPLQPYNSWVAYGTSKLALVHATFELQRRHAASNVNAYCLHPGAVFTHIADKGLEGSRVLAAVRKVMAPVEAFFLLTPDEGAQTSVHCATRPGLAGGLYYRGCQSAPPSSEAGDGQVAMRLWDNTAAWLAALPP